ncbi:VWA domain-containing protein [Candidatus Woesearchaeota archaeon]|nr:VWA domain-containing protein [Candidatus Woesearchaeota archaeon]
MVPEKGMDDAADLAIMQMSEAEELSGKLSFQDLEDKFMHSVMENDQSVIDDGKMIEQAINQGIGSFTPDLLFEQLVQEYSLTEQLYGKTILRQLFGYDPDYIQKNISIPEFQRLLRQRLEENIRHLKKEKFLDASYHLTSKAYELASLVMCVEELDHILPKGIRGERVHEKKSHYGAKDDVRLFRKGDRYHDISLKKSIHAAVRHGHHALGTPDLRAFERQSRGQCYLIYAIDASGSMKGSKIGSCKKAGIALAYKAIQNKDKVGLIVFGDEVRAFVEPTHDFPRLLREISSVRASNQTDIAATIRKAAELFPASGGVTKHLLLLTDAMPTAGNKPEQATLDAVAIARNKGITISIAGISLDEKGETLASRIVELGKGKLYRIRDVDEIDRIVLEDYYGV